MKGWGALVLVAVVTAVGALGTFAVAAAMGMGGAELVDLAAFLVPALVVTVVAMWIAGRMLSSATLAQRFVAVAALGVAMALANMWVLSRQMFVSAHDATLLAVLLLYSVGVGISAAVVIARSSSRAIRRLTTAAAAYGDGDLRERSGPLGAGPELDLLSKTLDEMAERLELALERERAADATRRDLVTAVSHDLRTPLASLRAMVEAIDDGVVDDPPTLRRYAGEMRRSMAQVVAMVDDLFELAQLDSGAIELEAARSRLRDVVASAVATVEHDVVEKGLELVTTLNGVEAAPCSPRLARVLQNLLVNAVRHTPADGTIRVEAQRSTTGLEVSVTDSGEGMSPEVAAHVFDPFFRADPARHGPGAGLGLALAKRIVETLGGDLTVESSPAGSRFALVVPLG
jgi:signal transduction histidine kinase